MDNQGQLLARARQGDGQAFEELCAPYSAMVYRHCLQMLRQPADAEDAAQEAMLRAFRAIPRFVGRSGIGTWLYRIAHNACLDMLKRPARRREAASLEEMSQAGQEPAAQEGGPEAQYLRQAEAQRLREAILQLPLEQQTLLNLRYGSGLSYQELAQATGLREGTVKSKLNRAKAHLRELLPL